MAFKPKPYQVVKNTGEDLLFLEKSYLYRQCEGYNSSNTSKSNETSEYKTFWMLTVNKIASTEDKP